MHAIVIDAPGGPEVLVYREVPTPEPHARSVRVRVEAAGVNFMDVYARQGTKPYAGSYPFTPGGEGAGTIEALGPGVTEFCVGDRVAWAGVPGSYATRLVAPVEKLVAIPAGVETQAAAAVMLQGMTAHYLTESTYPLAPGKVALVHAGAGGVGLLLTQLAKRRGATVIATVSTPEKAALSRAAGADHVVRYTEEDFTERARALTGGRGVDVAYDSVGKTTFDGSLAALARRGMLVLYGAASGAVPPVDLRLLAAGGSLFLTRPSLGDYLADRAELLARAGDLFAALTDGTLKLRVEHIYPLADARRAHEDIQSRKTTGKLLLLP